MHGFDADDSEAAHTFKALMADILTEADLPTNEAAAKLNISSERLYKYLNQGIPNSLPAYLVPIWTRMIGPQLLQHLAQDAHYAVAELPAVIQDWKDAVDLAAQVMRECGEVLRLIGESIDHEEVTFRDYREIQRACQKALGAVLGIQVMTIHKVKIVPKPGEGRVS